MTCCFLKTECFLCVLKQRQINASVEQNLNTVMIWLPNLSGIQFIWSSSLAELSDMQCSRTPPHVSEETVPCIRAQRLWRRWREGWSGTGKWRALCSEVQPNWRRARLHKILRKAHEYIFFVNLKCKHSLLLVKFFEMAAKPFPCNSLFFVVLI